MQLWHVTRETTTARRRKQEKNGKGKGEKEGSKKKATRGASIDWDASHAIGLTTRRGPWKGLTITITGGVDSESWLCIFISSENFRTALCAAYLSEWGECDWHSGCGTLMMPQINCSTSPLSLSLSLLLVLPAIATQLRESNLFDILPGKDGKLFCVLDQKSRINVIVNSTPKTHTQWRVIYTNGFLLNLFSGTFARPFRVNFNHSIRRFSLILPSATWKPWFILFLMKFFVVYFIDKYILHIYVLLTFYWFRLKNNERNDR